MGRTDIVSGPAVQGPAGCKAPARCRNGAGVWTGGGECEPNAGLRSRTTRAPIFKSFFAQGRELGDDQRMSFGILSRRSSINQYAGGVQDEPHLIGERRKTGSSIRRELALVAI